MAEITLVRNSIAPTSDLWFAGNAPIDMLDGESAADNAAWRRMWKRAISAEPGTVLKIRASFPRNSLFHRKFFAMLAIGFDAWEPPRRRKMHKGQPITKNLDQFRKDVLILAGFYNQVFRLDGTMVLEAQSISFSDMDQIEFERVYSAVADVLLTRVLSAYAGRDELDAVVERIICMI